jgi:hypothetical protein
MNWLFEKKIKPTDVDQYSRVLLSQQEKIIAAKMLNKINLKISPNW